MSPNKPMIITHSDYLDSCNANFCGGVIYACESINAVVMKAKNPNKQLLKHIKDLKEEAEKVKKELTFNGKKSK